MGRFARNGVPDRWYPYKKFGIQITGTKFISFKVPLKDDISRQIENPQEKFTPSQLVEEVPNLGLIIDLTNTARYYDSREFTDNGIAYKKIFCPGKQVPPLDIVRRFFDTVNEFLKSNESNHDLLIGVHCTHGVNRTGYFICRYMIESLGISPSEAVTAFNKARGHDIERESYVEVLQRLKPGELTDDSDFVSSSEPHRDNKFNDTRRDSKNSREPEPMRRAGGRRSVSREPMGSGGRWNYVSRARNDDKPWIHGQTSPEPQRRRFKTPPYRPREGSHGFDSYNRQTRTGSEKPAYSNESNPYRNSRDSYNSRNHYTDRTYDSHYNSSNSGRTRDSYGFNNNYRGNQDSVSPLERAYNDSAPYMRGQDSYSKYNSRGPRNDSYSSNYVSNGPSWGGKEPFNSRRPR